MNRPFPKRRSGLLRWFRNDLAAIVAVIAMPALCVPQAFAERTLGDIDNDGVATVRDMAKITGHLTGLASLPEPLRTYADINGDGAVNDVDVNLLIDEILDTRDPQLLPLSTVRFASPGDGEGDVAITRETQVHFSVPLSPGATLSTDEFYAEFGGERILSRVEIASDRRKATLFYLEPLPSNARIQVTLDGNGLTDLLGRMVDLDGDGQTGGDYRMSFDTLSITAVPGTAMVGRVFASEPATEPDGEPTDVPLAGVTISVDGAEETIRTTTDAQGNFTLDPCPAGTFFVHIDGRTSPASSYPGGNYYPSVGKRWEASPGRLNNLAGNSSDPEERRGTIYLPCICEGSLQPVSQTEATAIELPAEVLAEYPEMAGTSIAVPANSLFANDGTRGGSVGMAPVAPDRLPSPLPPGLEFPMVVTIQTDGAENFDQPVPVRFPNLPDPVTGETLPPGAKSALWSFDHDLGDWVIAGPMTVTEDGLFVKSDPGVGVREPGWHGSSQGCQIFKGGGFIPDCEIADGAAGKFLESYLISCAIPALTAAAIAAAVSLAPAGALAYYGTAGTVALFAGTTLVSGILGYISARFSCKGSGENPAVCNFWDAFNTSTTLVGMNQALSSYTFFISCPFSLVSAVSDFFDSVDCDEHKFKSVISKKSGGILEEAILQERILEGMADLALELFGDVAWLTSNDSEEILAEIRTRGTLESDGGGMISESEKGEVIEMFESDSLPDEEVKELIDRLNSSFVEFETGVLTPGSIRFDAVEDCIQELSDSVAHAQQLGWEHIYKIQSELAGGRILEEMMNEAGVGLSEVGEAFNYAITNLGDGLKISGRSTSGELPSIALSPNSMYKIQYYFLTSGRYTENTFRTSANGSRVGLARSLAPQVIGIDDSDGDLLNDSAEEVFGTSASDPDTDNDGIDDFTEIKNGTDPLDGIISSTGIIASVPDEGTTLDLCASNNIAVTARGSKGVSVFNIFAGLNPTKIAVVNTPGSARRVDCWGDLVAVADGPGGLAVVDVSSPESAHVARQVDLGSNAVAVATYGPIAYVGTDEGEMFEVHMESGEILQSVQAPGSGLVEDIAISGDTLYVGRVGSISAYALGAGTLTVSGSVGTLPKFPAQRRPERLFAGNDVLYTTHYRGWRSYDIATDPLNPTVIDTINTGQQVWKDIAMNGSGLALAVQRVSVSFPPHFADLYDVGADGRGSNFLTSFPIPSGEALTIVNGLAYIAGGGIKVVNYRSPDALGVPPLIALNSNRTLNPDGSGSATEGTIMRLSAAVTDDVQVRNVEFYIDDELARDDGTFPFEHRFVTPSRFDTTSITVKALARDTGGNETWSQEYTVSLQAETVPPILSEIVPADGSLLPPDDTLRVQFNEIMDVVSLQNGGILLTEAGADGVLGTADDVTVDPDSLDFVTETFTALLRFDDVLSGGLYRLEVTSLATDYAGNALPTGAISDFRFATGADIDNDGVIDDYESALGLIVGETDSDMNGTPDGEEDFDMDGVTNAEEFPLGFDPRLSDSDGNGIDDGQEDRDFDGITDVAELNGNTRFDLADTDGDGFDDATEIAAGMDPNDPNVLDAAAMSSRAAFINAVPEVIPSTEIPSRSAPVSFENNP